MGNTLKCCLSCVLPCGSLDLIRIVHLTGHVEEITGPITAGEVLKNYHNHVLTKPFSQGVVKRILIISNNSQLKRGNIYFLIPSSSIPEKKLEKQRRKTKHVGVPMSCSVVSSDVMVVSTKKSGHRRARRAVHGADWTPILESIYEE